MKRCIGWIALGLAIAPTYSSAETFFLKDGSALEGKVLRSLGNTLTIKLDDAGMHQLPVGLIDQVEVTSTDGTRVTGSIAWWKDKVYVLVTSQGLIQVKDGVISRVSDTNQPLSAAAEPTQLDADQDVVSPTSAVQPIVVEQPFQKLEPTM